MGNKRKFKNSNNRKSVAYARQMKRLKKDHIIENKSTQSNDTHTNYSNSVQTANPTSHIEESTNSNSVTYQPSCSLDITKSYSSECTTSNDIFSQLIDDLEILEDIGTQTVEKLLTASSFSKVCKRRSNISSAPLVKSLIYSYSLDNVPAVEYGKNNEKTAIKQLELQEGIVVQKCGLFIDIMTSPDGLFDEGIVEIKCPYSARNMDPEQAILEKKIKFWKIDGTINTNHDWYFQIQGQLHISQKNVCLFAVWTGQDFIMKTTKIMKDDIFWRTKMEPKLLAFYDKCFLPEMVDPRKGRSMPIREVQF